MMIYSKKPLFIAFLLTGSFLVAGIFSWANIHGSTFQASVLRGVSRILVAVASKPKPSVLLPVKFDKQDHALSCEVAVLKMALAYRGVTVSEDELIEKIGFDLTPKSGVNGVLTWGDPQKAFVGNIDGKMLVDGYGVYWFPIGRVGNEYRPTLIFEKWDEEKLVQQLLEGNPVLIWGYLGSGRPTSWKTSDGKEVKAVYYEHTFIVHGFAGDKLNPSGYFVIDPIYGEMYMAKSVFLKKWDAFGRSGMVVL